jgi:hypothetical protein
MGQFIENIQGKIKTGSTHFGLLIFRLFIGYVVGLTAALIAQKLIGFSDFSFYFFIVASIMVFLRISREWSFGGVLVFSLVCILLGLLLRMYIHVAPGA